MTSIIKRMAGVAKPHICRIATALAFTLGLVSTVWAADAPTISIDGTTVTINNETASSYDSSKTLTVSDAWQTKGFWLPTGTGLEAGKVVKVTSIAFAVPSTGNFVDKIGLAGCVSASAVRTTGGFTTASADKVLFSFEDSECFLLAGSSSQIWFLDSNGDKVATSTVLNFTLGGNSNQYIDNLGWTINSVFYTPVVEVVGEIMTGSSITGAQTAIGNSGSDPLYAFGVTGWLDTGNSKTGHIVLVENNSGANSIGVNNANSVNADGRHSTWSKLSGSGTLCALNGQNTGTTPVLEVYDASEFTGSIITANGGPRLSVVFGTSEDCATLRSSYNSFFTGSYLNSFYVTENGEVTIPAGKTWQASKLIVEGEATINGTFTGSVVNNGTLTLNGSVTGTITGSGALNLNVAGSYNLGARRDFTTVTTVSGVTLSITMTTEEYGKGSISVTGANGISSITVLALDGTTTVCTITPEAGAGTYNRGSVLVSGKACWVDYEMNGNRTNAGTDTTDLQQDGYADSAAFYNNSTLYTYTHPFRNNLAAYPANWTAVVRCTVPNLANAAIITFGNKDDGLLGLIAGDNPETQMKLVQTTGNSAYATKATMDVIDATSAQHVYVFAVENRQTLKCWCDGSLVLNETLESPVSIGAGFQIGSVVYGYGSTGIVRWWPGDAVFDALTPAVQAAAQIDCLRLYDYILSSEQISALSAEFPSVKLYRATAAADTDTTWEGGTLIWSPAWDGGNDQSKAILTTEGDATIALPADTITADEVELILATGSTLTLSGPGSLAVTKPITIGNGTLVLTGTMTLTQDTAFNGSVVFDAFTAAGTGALKLSSGATVGVASGSVIVTPLGSYTCAEGTVVDSVYTGDGVKLIPLTSAVVSITQNGTTLYYSDLDTGVGKLNVIDNVSDDVRCELLNGATWPTTPYDYAGILRTMGYYIDGNGILTKAVARISSTPYQTLAAAVAAAADGATVTLLLNSSETITLNKAITLSETGIFSGTLTGTGTLTFAAYRKNPSITFTDWTGTVVLPSFVADGTIFNNYGVAGSTVALNGITSGWLGETDTTNHRVEVLPVLQLDGAVTITGFSTAWSYIFGEITGVGVFSLDPLDNHPKSASITKVAAGFSGSIYSDIDTTLTIGTIDREAGTQVTGGMKLLTTSGSGDITASALTVGGAAQSVTLCTESDGIYVAAASVQKGENPATYHTTVAAAMTEAGSDAATITLLANTSSDIALAVGQSLATGGFSVGTVSTSAEHYHVVNNAGVYTVAKDVSGVLILAF